MNPAIAKHLSNAPITSIGALLAEVDGPEQVYAAIANEEVYFDIQRDLVLDHSAPVYLNRDLWEADRAVRLSPETKVNGVGCIKLNVGAKLQLDGVLMAVLDRTASSVGLASKRGDIRTVDLADVPALLAAGRLIQSDRCLDVATEARKLIEAATPRTLSRALKRFRRIEPWVRGLRSDSPSSRSVRRYVKKFREAEAAYGIGFVGLLDRIDRRGNREPRFTTEVRAMAAEVIQDELLRPNPTSVTTAHRMLCGRLREAGLASMRIKAFRNLVKKLQPHELDRAQYGHKAANSTRPPSPRFDPTVGGDGAFDVVHIDSTQLDVELISERTGVNIGCAWITLAINANPTHPLGCYVSLERPNGVSVLMAVRDVVRRHNRLPKLIVHDLGSEHLTIAFDILKASYGVDFIRRAAGNPRFGAVIESFNHGFNKHVLHQLKGHKHSKISVRARSAAHSPQVNAVWTLEAMLDVVDEYLFEIFPDLPHAGCAGIPRQLFEESLQAQGKVDARFVPFDEHFRVMTLPLFTREPTVKYRRGIRVAHLDYWANEFSNSKWINQKVAVRYDPEDASFVHALLGDRWVRCECRSTILGRLAFREIKALTKELKAEYAATGRAKRASMVDLECFLLRLRRKEEQLQHERTVNRSTAATESELKDDPGRDQSDPIPALEFSDDELSTLSVEAF